MTAAPDRPTGELRLSMTLPGSASLGAYQAGAVAALAVMINELRRRDVDVRLDAIGGSSAGSIVGMLFAHCLLTGRDAPSLLRDAWVDEVDVELLRSGGADSPLAFDDLRSKLVDFLADTERHPLDVEEPLPSPVTIEVGLTSLLGLEVPVRSPNGEIPTLTFADRAVFELGPGHDPETLAERSGPLDAVLVSACHPLGFRPERYDRSDARDDYAARGIDNLPDDARLWYTDGGLVESEPVGRIVRAAREQAGNGGGRRLHLVVDPRSSGPSGDERWADPEFHPTWLDGLRRAVSLVPTQALHDDIRSVVANNDRLRALDEVVDDLAAHLPGGRRDELRERLLAAAGLDGGEIVDVEMITPLRITERSDAGDDAEGVSDLLAGDFVGAFGGFLDRRVRRSDFALGWICACRWIADELPRYGIADDVVQQVAKTLDADDTIGRADHDAEGDGVAQTGVVGRWRLALLAAQTGRVLVSAAFPWSPLVRLRGLVGRTSSSSGG